MGRPASDFVQVTSTLIVDSWYRLFIETSNHRKAEILGARVADDATPMLVTRLEGSSPQNCYALRLNESYTNASARADRDFVYFAHV